MKSNQKLLNNVERDEVGLISSLIKDLEDKRIAILEVQASVGDGQSDRGIAHRILAGLHGLEQLLGDISTVFLKLA